MFQKSSPVIHIWYDSICDILVKLMRRFLIADAIEQKYGSNLTTIECSKKKLQLLDKELVIGDSTRQALKDLTHDQQRTAIPGIWTFFVSVTSYLQQKLPLSSEFLHQLGCLNPSKKVKSQQWNLFRTLLKCCNQRSVQQVDNNLPHYNPSERIEVFWNGVFELHLVDRSMRYKVLPSIIKSALELAQTNAESERSLSVNARIVTQERASLGEKLSLVFILSKKLLSPLIQSLIDQKWFQ